DSDPDAQVTCFPHEPGHSPVRVQIAPGWPLPVQDFQPALVLAALGLGARRQVSDERPVSRVVHHHSDASGGAAGAGGGGAAGPGTRWEADRSALARWQYSSTTREPRSSPSRVDSPALAPIRLAALAAVTAPPQEIANSSAKISSPGAGRAGTSPKTISRN